MGVQDFEDTFKKDIEFVNADAIGMYETIKDGKFSGTQELGDFYIAHANSHFNTRGGIEGSVMGYDGDNFYTVELYVPVEHFSNTPTYSVRSDGGPITISVDTGADLEDMKVYRLPPVQITIEEIQGKQQFEIERLILERSKNRVYRETPEAFEKMFPDEYKERIVAELVEEAEWKIDQEGFEKFQTAAVPDDVDYVCSVHFGNHVFDFVGRGDGSNGFYLDYDQYVPAQDVDEAFHHQIDGQLLKKEFKFPLSPKELDHFYYIEQSADGSFARTDKNAESIEEFKRNVVLKLLDDKMIAMKPDEYRFMHDNEICYHQQFAKQRDIYLSQLAKQDKLSPDDLINISRFYFNNNYSAKDVPRSIEKIVDKMDYAGFPETKKNIMFASMAKLIDDPVQREVFMNTTKMYSGLKRKAVAHDRGITNTI